MPKKKVKKTDSNDDLDENIIVDQALTELKPIDVHKSFPDSDNDLEFLENLINSLNDENTSNEDDLIFFEDWIEPYLDDNVFMGFLTSFMDLESYNNLQVDGKILLKLEDTINDLIKFYPVL